MAPGRIELRLHNALFNEGGFEMLQIESIEKGSISLSHTALSSCYGGELANDISGELRQKCHRIRAD